MNQTSAATPKSSPAPASPSSPSTVGAPAKEAAKGALRGKESVIFIGAKPPMNYVFAIVTQFNAGNLTVTLKARGRAISRAVDVAEIVRTKFVEKCSVAGVEIGTELVTNEDGRKANVSTITIHLAKQA